METTNQLYDLRCEYLSNPLGIDVPHPRLSWKTRDDRRDVMQTAYQVLVASSVEALAEDRGDLWDSGWVESAESNQVSYAGEILQSRQQAYWKCRTRLACGGAADAGPTAWSAPQRWEMGLLTPADWSARWIQTTVVGGPRSIPPCPYLRREFALQKPIASARLFVTALGLFECEINGQRVGEDVFAPGRTEYRKRVPYHVYDVTEHLVAGENAIGAILGDGWYCGHVHSDPRMYDGDRPRLIAQLEIRHTDGSTSTVVTDESWRFTADGPIRSSDLLQGEDYDARMEIPGWSKPGYAARDWSAVRTWDAPQIDLIARRIPAVRRIEDRRPAIAPFNPPGKRNRWNFDFGQNLVGRIRIKLRNTKPGQIITIRHAEMLDKTGKLYVEALRTARATDYYTCRGAAEEVYEPRFTFHGFRYIEVNGLPHAPSVPPEDTVTAIVLHTPLDWTGSFNCSDPMINQLQSNIRWSQRSNFLEIPTDCPQRDERLGWTGDAQVFCRTSAFNMNVAPFFTKWMQDVSDAQFESGGIPSTVPFCVSIPKEGGPAWSDAAIICPWTIYLCYGDKQILRDRWQTMCRFIEYLKQHSQDLIRYHENREWGGYGDWLSINAETPKELIGTAFFEHCTRLLSKIAMLLGHAAQAKEYLELSEQIRLAWQRAYVQADGSLVAPTQTAHVLALHFNLLDPHHRPSAFAALVDDIQARGTHLSTGFVGTPYLTHVLTQHGRADLAFSLLQQTTYPSWLYPITQGATTMWERWDAYTHDKGFNDAGMNSYNHYAYGAVGEWMYSTVAGIDLDPAVPGYRHVVIRPHVGGTLTHASAKLESPFGPIESGWRLERGTLTVRVVIPPNTTASIRIPSSKPSAVTERLASASPVATIDGAAVYEVGSGVYEFVGPMAQ